MNIDYKEKYHMMSEEGVKEFNENLQAAFMNENGTIFIATVKSNYDFLGLDLGDVPFTVVRYSLTVTYVQENVSLSKVYTLPLMNINTIYENRYTFEEINSMLFRILNSMCKSVSDSFLIENNTN